MLLPLSCQGSHLARWRFHFNFYQPLFRLPLSVCGRAASDHFLSSGLSTEVSRREALRRHRGHLCAFRPGCDLGWVAVNLGAGASIHRNIPPFRKWLVLHFQTRLDLWRRRDQARPPHAPVGLPDLPHRTRWASSLGIAGTAQRRDCATQSRGGRVYPRASGRWRNQLWDQ